MRRNLIICGGGIAGLAAGKALAEHFEKVVIIEARRFQGPGEFDRPVAQGHHVHHLLRSGLNALLQFCPQFEGGLASSGAVELDYSSDIATIGKEGIYPQWRSGLSVFSQSRKLIEDLLIREVRASSNVEFIDGTKVIGLTMNANLVQTVVAKRGGDLVAFDADLVLDCTGGWSGGRSHLLRLCDLYAVNEVHCDVELHFRSFKAGTVELSVDGREPRGLILSPRETDSRFMIMMPQEGGGHTITFGSKSDALSFIDSRDPSRLSKLCMERGLKFEVVCPKALSKLSQDRISWHRFSVGELPGNLLPIGDSVCTLTPFSGQGMALALREVALLGELLLEVKELSTLQIQYLDILKTIVRPCWLHSIVMEFGSSRARWENSEFGSDLQELTNLYANAYTDPLAARRLLTARHLLKSPDW